MGRYNFVSPAGDTNAIMEQLLLRERLRQETKDREQARLDAIANRERQIASDKRADAQLNLQRQQFEINAARQAELDRIAAETRATAAARERDKRGVLGMMGAVYGGGPLDDERARSIAGMSLSEGVEVPGIIEQSLERHLNPKRHVISVPDPSNPANPMSKVVTEEDLEAGVPTYRAPAQGPQPDYQWVLRNGKPVEVVKGRSLPGDVPTSGQGGGGGRGVLSSDAGRIASFDSALDDVNVLRSTVTPESGQAATTGVLPGIAASMPNWVTEVTGWGVDAKSRQAVINRVKQVIGKALEGGVLRKEDEAKYKQILPTIDDPPEVVVTKLQGLEAAIVAARERHLEALEAAGYNVSKFPADSRKQPVSVKAPNGKTYTFPTQEKADEFKRAAGMQ